MQAACVTEWATALKAGCTVQRGLVAALILQPEHAGPGIERRCVQWTAGAKNRHLAHAQRSGDMHQARIIADRALRGSYQMKSLDEVCSSRQVQALANL